MQHNYDNENTWADNAINSQPSQALSGVSWTCSRLTIYIANSPIRIDHHRSPTLRDAIDFSITSHFQMASIEWTPCYGQCCLLYATGNLADISKLKQVSVSNLYSHAMPSTYILLHVINLCQLEFKSNSVPVLRRPVSGSDRICFDYTVIAWVCTFNLQ